MGRDSQYRTGSWPSVVVWPESTEDVVKVVKIANKYRMPVVPYSGGTSLEGHFVGVRMRVLLLFLRCLGDNKDHLY